MAMVIFNYIKILLENISIHQTVKICMSMETHGSMTVTSYLLITSPPQLLTCHSQASSNVHNKDLNTFVKAIQLYFSR